MKYRVTVNGKEFAATVLGRSNDEITFSVADQSYTVGVTPIIALNTGSSNGAVTSAVIVPASAPSSKTQSHGAPGEVRSPMPGIVVKILVSEGAAVKRGQQLAIVEAMKMENSIAAPCDGTVQKVLVTAGAQVEGGAVLLKIN